jgi:hypothetical protein
MPMTARERLAVAMNPRRGQTPDRVPVMCQLALGHYFLNARGGPVEIWHDGPSFASALLELAERYEFDGVLVNLPGRDPAWRSHLRAVETASDTVRLQWDNGLITICPVDDNPHVVPAGAGRPREVGFREIDIDALRYVEPHDAAGVTNLTTFPSWHWDTLKLVRERAPNLSVHAEVFSPWSQVMELTGIMEAALAIALDPARLRAALERLTAGAIELALGHAAAGADAILMSSAYASAAFLSPTHYEQFVLPYEQALVAALKRAYPDLPVYTHTCGAIDDRLELMAASGTDGIDTLDPPPLGNVDLADAKRRLGGRLFIKGNVDPVNIVLRGTPDMCYQDAIERIRIAAPGGGYILSTACSVPPHAPAENIHALARAAAEAGSVT